jgi:hypothetical protein
LSSCACLLSELPQAAMIAMMPMKIRIFFIRGIEDEG